MTARLAIVALLLSVNAAQAAGGPFFSLANTDFVVAISFVLFAGALIYFRAPHFAGRLIDSRIDLLRQDIEEVGRLEGEARDKLKQAEAESQLAEERAGRMVEAARESAGRLVDEAKVAAKREGERRLDAAREQFAAAEISVQTEIRNRAIEIAVSSAAHIISDRMTEGDRDASFDRALAEIKANI